MCIVQKSLQIQIYHQESFHQLPNQLKDNRTEYYNMWMNVCWYNTYLYREYGYAPRRSAGVWKDICGRKYKRYGIVAAKMADKILAPLQYSGTMDSSFFEFWFSNQLLPSLDKGTVIVMDNASFHSKKRLFLLPKILDAGFCSYLHIPRNSIPLKISGPGWNYFYVKYFSLSLRSMMPSLPLFNCGNYSFGGEGKIWAV